MGKKIQPPAKVGDITQEMLADLAKALGTDLLSATLFGSAADEARYAGGKSDIGLLLLLAEDAANPLKRLMGFCQKWRPARVSPPLLMTPSYLEGSRDAFPIELLIMAASHRTILGEDPLADLRVEKVDLRLQLERELKAKLMALSTRVLASDGGTQSLSRIVAEAAPAFTALFQALLWLLKGSFPLAADEVLAAAAEAGYRLEAIRTLSLVRAGQVRPTPGELLVILEDAAAELKLLSTLVDAMEV